MEDSQVRVPTGQTNINRKEESRLCQDKDEILNHESQEGWKENSVSKIPSK